MVLNDKEIDFIKKNITDAESLLKSADPNDYITDIGRQAERIIDKIVYSD